MKGEGSVNKYGFYLQLTGLLTLVGYICFVLLLTLLLTGFETKIRVLCSQCPVCKQTVQDSWCDHGWPRPHFLLVNLLFNLTNDSRGDNDGVKHAWFLSVLAV